MMWRIEILRLCEAACAVLIGAAGCYLAFAAAPGLATAGTVAAIGVLGVWFFGWQRDAEVRYNVYDDAQKVAAKNIQLVEQWATAQEPDPPALPEHARALRDDIGAVLKDIAAMQRRLEADVADLLLDHLDAHDQRTHAEAKHARLERIQETAAAARRLLAEDPGPVPMAPVARLAARQAVAAPEPSAVSTEALEKLHDELMAGGIRG